MSKTQNNLSFGKISNKWFQASIKERYSYRFTWMGRPIIQYPTDMLAMQEIIWKIKPDLIIETGIAHGGSLIYYASLISMLGGNHRKIIGIDVDIRAHNRKAIEEHCMYEKIDLIEGSSILPQTVAQVKKIAKNHSVILVVLDSNHTHAHVLEELNLYSLLVTNGSYLVVFDTYIEDLPKNSFPDRPWEVGDNPKTAVFEFLQNNDRFVIDKEIEERLMVTAAPSGYLKCIKN